jgi:CheY-like chemotaxis protein
MPDDKYCICCGENVPANTIMRDGNIELTCLYCGFVLDVTRPGARKELECVLTADDSPLTRDLLRGMLLKRQLARDVVSVENGQAFVAAFTQRVTANQPLSLVILDLEMPVMDGITAARIIRTVETKCGVAKTPILFFSGRKCDDGFKRQLEALAPASYVNKGSDADPEQLIERIDQLVIHLQNQNPSA